MGSGNDTWNIARIDVYKRQRLYNYVMVGKSLGVITGNTWERDDNGNIIFHELSASQKALYGGEYVPCLLYTSS